MSTLTATSPGAITGGYISNSLSSGGLISSSTTGTSQVAISPMNNGDFTVSGWLTLGASGALGNGPKFTVKSDSIDVSFAEVENGFRVRATLNPDTHLSTIELLRLNVLLAAGKDVTHPLSYIRAHSLERHFNFEAE